MCPVHAHNTARASLKPTSLSPLSVSPLCLAYHAFGFRLEGARPPASAASWWSCARCRAASAPGAPEQPTSPCLIHLVHGRLAPIKRPNTLANKSTKSVLPHYQVHCAYIAKSMKGSHSQSAESVHQGIPQVHVALHWLSLTPVCLLRYHGHATVLTWVGEKIA